MLRFLRNLFRSKKEIDLKGIKYCEEGGEEKIAYYFETFDAWVSMDEPIVFENFESDEPKETPLNQWLIKVREGMKIQWWELQLLEDHHMQLLDMYWKKI